MVTLHDILERARASGQKLSPGEALWLFAAVTREAAEKKATVRSRLVQIDPNGVLQLARFDEKRPEDEPGYLAPELLEKGGPRKDEPRVQVYAAGALGYEIFTGQPPDPRKGPGPELTGPAADVVRIAMARDRRERFGDLHQLREAVEALQQPADPDAERHTFAALVARGEKSGATPDLGRAALTKLIEHVGQLGRQMEAVRSGLADGQRDQRDLLARVAVLESRGGTAAAPAKGRSGAVAAVVAGMLGAALAVVLLGVAAVKMPRLGARLLRTAVGAPATASVVGPSSSSAASPSSAPAAGTVANTAPTASAASTTAPNPQPPANASATVNPTPTATASPTAAPPSPTATASPTAAPPSPTATASAPHDGTTANTAPEKPESAKPSQAEMARAVAEAQVRRGDQELEQGRYDAAAEEFQLALANDPTIAVAWRGLGIAHLMRHNEASARKAYVKYLQLAPTAPDARDIRRAIAELNARAKIGAGAEK